VFADPERLRALESILHPTMKAEVRREVQSFLEKNVPVCINAALLFKMGLEELCDHVLLIRASLPVRFRRARKRDGLGIREFLHRIRSQKGLFPGPSRPSGLPRIFSGTFTSQRVVKSGAVFSKNSGKHVDIYTVWNSSDPETLRRRLEEYLILIEWQA
jgi:dephospho-CoA kinase